MKNRIADRTIFFLAALEIYAPASLFAGPKDNCLPPREAQRPAQALSVPGTPYTVDVCYEPEQTVGGLLQDSRDRVRLKKNGRVVAQQIVTTPVTVGRLSDLALEKATPHYLALSYSNCEFGNALVIFNLKIPAVAHHRPCTGAPVDCRVADLQDSVATVECREIEAEGLPPKNPSPITTKVVLPE
ncbi:MAG: hypothetical protein IPP68_04855 [Elusimicrobia bacterium]|nr:hypothetical protein [Elusimicrobiota bacterium]